MTMMENVMSLSLCHSLKTREPALRIDHSREVMLELANGRWRLGHGKGIRAGAILLEQEQQS